MWNQNKDMVQTFRCENSLMIQSQTHAGGTWKKTGQSEEAEQFLIFLESASFSFTCGWQWW